MTALLELQSVKKTFHQGGIELTVWEDVSLILKPGEMVALVGPSGSGKSTLLQVAGLLERPTSGDVILCGQNCTHLSDHKRTLYRRQSLGFVYQYHLLLPEFSALENVMLPQLIAGVSQRQAKRKAENLLDTLGLSARLTHRPKALSGGEQQRVAIARALANDPHVLLADEPTGNLDSHTAGKVFDALLKTVRGRNVSALLATHNLDLAKQMDRVFFLREGQLVEEKL